MDWISSDLLPRFGWHICHQYWLFSLLAVMTEASVTFPTHAFDVQTDPWSVQCLSLFSYISPHEVPLVDTTERILMHGLQNQPPVLSEH